LAVTAHGVADLTGGGGTTTTGGGSGDGEGSGLFVGPLHAEKPKIKTVNAPTSSIFHRLLIVRS
jgi:hypothetical protein